MRYNRGKRTKLAAAAQESYPPSGLYVAAYLPHTTTLRRTAHPIIPLSSPFFKGLGRFLLPVFGVARPPEVFPPLYLSVPSWRCIICESPFLILIHYFTLQPILDTFRADMFYIWGAKVQK